MAEAKQDAADRHERDEQARELAAITGGTPATQQDAPQYIAEDEPELDAVDAASADSFPTSDPPSASNPSALT